MKINTESLFYKEWALQVPEEVTKEHLRRKLKELGCHPTFIRTPPTKNGLTFVFIDAPDNLRERIHPEDAVIVAAHIVQRPRDAHGNHDNSC